MSHPDDRYQLGHGSEFRSIGSRRRWQVARASVSRGKARRNGGSRNRTEEMIEDEPSPSGRWRFSTQGVARLQSGTENGEMHHQKTCHGDHATIALSRCNSNDENDEIGNLIAPSFTVCRTTRASFFFLQLERELSHAVPRSRAPSCCGERVVRRSNDGDEHRVGTSPGIGECFGK